MDIDRHEPQGGIDVARERLEFVLDRLEQGEFRRGIGWGSCIVPHCTVEELIGALVAAEQALQGLGDDE